MRHPLSFALVLLFLLSSSIANSQDAKITFLNPRVETGMQFYEISNPSAEAFIEQTIMGLKDCRFIPSGKYVYFRVDDGLVLTSDACIHKISISNNRFVTRKANKG